MKCIETVCFSWYLEDLDGKQINELSRQFLINWKASKDAKKKLDDGKDIKEQTTNPLTRIFAAIFYSFHYIFIKLFTIIYINELYRLKLNVKYVKYMTLHTMKKVPQLVTVISFTEFCAEYIAVTLSFCSLIFQSFTVSWRFSVY